MIKSASRSSITNDQKYRSMLAGAVPSNEYLIESRVLDTAVTQVTFNNLDQFAGVYKHLQIVSTERQSNAVSESRGVLSINGSNGVRTHYLVGTGTTVVSISESGDIPLYSAGSYLVTNN